MTITQTPSQTITEEVTSWPGVEAGPGRRGEFAFKVGRREIGHLHGDHSAHFFFPARYGSSFASRAGSSSTPSSRASRVRPRAGSRAPMTSAT